MSKIRVAIDARLPDALAGGVQQVLCTLAQGFSQIQSSDIERTWITYKNTSWWRDYIPPNDARIEVRPPGGILGLFLARSFPSVVSRLSPWIALFKIKRFPFDRLLESRNINIVHLPFQEGFRTSLPYIYHPHDLQHCHHPEFFSSSQINRRDSYWCNLARQASVVIAETTFVVSDLQAFWRVEESKIQVLPTPPLKRRSHSRNSPRGTYLLYPAAFWPHKNHASLIASLSLLKSRGVIVNLVLTGAKVGNFDSVKEQVAVTGLDRQVSFLGHIPDGDFLNLLKNATGLIMPSLFESFSLPVWEALSLGVPVACSNVDALPSQVGEAGILFNPMDVESIAGAVEKIWTDSELRTRLTSAGLRRTHNLEPDYFAKSFCALYQKTLGVEIEKSFMNSLLEFEAIGLLRS